MKKKTDVQINFVLFTLYHDIVYCRENRWARWKDK